MTTENRKPTAADPEITISPNPNRVIVRLGGRVIADSTRALVMRAPGTPSDQYIPREDVEMAALTRTSHVTHCPYKGDASYWTIRSGERVLENAVWSYESPYPRVAQIEGYLAFYANRVDAIEEQPR
jgi:uncharacterized protein (DUF427 family)